MTANASPAVLAPVDVAAVLEALGTLEYFAGDETQRTLSADEYAGLIRAAVERLAADLAAATLREASLCDAVKLLNLQLEAAEADAARYRWLRKFSTNAYHAPDSSRPILVWQEGYDGDWTARMDAAIDAALQEPRNGTD